MKTKFCKKGHALSPDNLFVWTQRSKHGNLYERTKCLACHNQAKEDSAEKRRARGRERYQQNLEQIERYRKTYQNENRQKMRDASKRYHAEHREEQLRKKKDERVLIRTAFLEMYGGRCALCDPSNPDAWEYEFLTLDHVLLDGIEHRSQKKDLQIYKEAVSNGSPDFSRFRILCHNHNQWLGHSHTPYDKLSRTGRNARDLKDLVIAGYGGVCACCGCLIREFLQLDHVNGGGIAQIRNSSLSHYRDARNRNFPEDYQVLCANCNCSKHYGKGLCVHKRKFTTTEGGLLVPTRELNIVEALA